MGAIFNIIANPDSSTDRMVVPLVDRSGDGCVELRSIEDGLGKIPLFDGSSVMRGNMRHKVVELECDRLNAASHGMLTRLMMSRTAVTVDPLIGQSTVASWRAVRGSTDLVGNAISMYGSAASAAAWDPWRKRMVLGGGQSYPCVGLETPFGVGVVTDNNYTNLVTGWGDLYVGNATGRTISSPPEMSGWDSSIYEAHAAAGQQYTPYIAIDIGDKITPDGIIGVSFVARGSFGASATVYIQTRDAGGNYINTAGRRYIFSSEGIVLSDWTLIDTAASPPADAGGVWNTSDPSYTRIVITFSTPYSPSDAILQIGAIAVKCVATTIRQAIPSLPTFGANATACQMLVNDMPQVGSLTVSLVRVAQSGGCRLGFYGLFDLGQTPNSGANNNGKLTFFRDSNRVALVLADTVVSIPAANLDDGAPHAITYTFASRVARGYLDGRLIVEQSLPSAPNFNGGSLRFGRPAYAAYPLLITGVRVDGETLSDQEVAGLHAAMTDPPAVLAARRLSGRRFRIVGVPDRVAGSGPAGDTVWRGTLALEQVSSDPDRLDAIFGG